ncbi:MAG: hypothetical protein AAB510_03060 [Patescibacteria group bacterium]
MNYPPQQAELRCDVVKRGKATWKICNDGSTVMLDDGKGGDGGGFWNSTGGKLTLMGIGGGIGYGVGRLTAPKGVKIPKGKFTPKKPVKLPPIVRSLPKT